MKRNMRQGWMAAVVLALAAGLSRADEAKQNVAVNASFEEIPVESADPPGWFVYSTRDPAWSVTVDRKKTGERAIRLKAQQVKGACACIYQAMPVVAGEKYKFSVFVSNDPWDPLAGSAYGVAVIEWRDADGKEIKRIESKPWDTKLAMSGWQLFSVDGAVPKEASKAHFVVYVCDGNDKGAGTCYVDDAQIVLQKSASMPTPVASNPAPSMPTPGPEAKIKGSARSRIEASKAERASRAKSLPMVADSSR